MPDDDLALVDCGRLVEQARVLVDQAGRADAGFAAGSPRSDPQPGTGVAAPIDPIAHEADILGGVGLELRRAVRLLRAMLTEQQGRLGDVRNEVAELRSGRSKLMDDLKPTEAFLAGMADEFTGEMTGAVSRVAGRLESAVTDQSRGTAGPRSDGANRE